MYDSKSNVHDKTDNSLFAEGLSTTLKRYYLVCFFSTLLLIAWIVLSSSKTRTFLVSNHENL
ncbi:hypothetical protein UR09_05875 [Candidatus Nitromaritima sp. SCGC AAA799-A02]|nr:hypothetical protein UR09_05875 [Candidatus Nitromaritima sp. SCGC AAA799-A02]